MNKDREMRPWFAVGLWAALCVVGTFYATGRGFVGRPFAAMIAATAVLLAGEIWLAAPGIREPLVRATGPQGGALVALWPLGAYVLYALGTDSFTRTRLIIALAYTLIPVALAASAHASKPGVWQDYAILLAIGLPARLGWLHQLFPYPKFLLGGVLSLLLAVNVGLAAFVVMRRMDGIGYSMGWKLRWGIIIVLCFLVFAVLMIPLATAIHFVRYAPTRHPWRDFPLDFLGIFVITGWPEEFAFRGVLQNALRSTLRSETAALIVASILFGLSHIDRGLFPNWRYVFLAAIAGAIYGVAWRRSGSMFPAAVVHGLVDTTWRVFFRTL